MRLFFGLLTVSMIFTALPLTAVEFTSASAAKEMTKKSTEELTKKLMESKNGKESYELLTKLIDDGIKKIAGGGYYNIFNLNNLNSKKELEAFKKLLPNEKEYELMKSIVEQELISKGYQVQRGQYDFSGNLHLIISWGK